MRGRDLEQAHMLMAQGKLPQRQYTPQENQRWAEFCRAFVRFANRHGYHPTALDRDSMEGLTKESGGWIRSRVLYDVVTCYFPLTDNQAPCPFCDGGTFRISEDRWQCDICGPVNCDRCGAGGDVADFVAKYEHVTRERAEEMIDRRDTSSEHPR